MPSTPTPRLRVMQQARGEGLNAWGDPNLNNALQRLEEGQAKVLTLTITGDRALTAQNYIEDEARSAVLVLIGTPTATFKVAIPAVEKPYLVDNRTGQVCTIGTAGGVGAQVRAGMMNTVFCNGSDTRIVDPTLDQIRKATAAVDLNGQKITNLGSASADNDAPTFGQIKTATQTAVSAAGTATAARDITVAARNDAVAAYDSFDDRWLGPKASDPSTDNDGDSLLTGAVYFNTISASFRVWTGSLWQGVLPGAADYLLKSGGNMTGLITFSADQYATKAQAEAGSDTVKLITPQRVAEYVAARRNVNGGLAALDANGRIVGDGSQLTGLGLFGVGQTWQSVSRSSGISYQNVTGRPIMVASIMALFSNQSVSTISVSANNSTFLEVARSAAFSGAGEITLNAVIPNNHYYRFEGQSSLTIMELR